MAPEASFAECHELIEEMRRIYATDEDAVKVRSLNQQFKEVRKLCDDREAHMQTVIKEMVKRVADAETKATPSESPSCLLYTSPSPRDLSTSRMPSSA